VTGERRSLEVVQVSFAAGVSCFAKLRSQPLWQRKMSCEKNSLGLQRNRGLQKEEWLWFEDEVFL
jgi:hypothetical protein